MAQIQTLTAPNGKEIIVSHVLWEVILMLIRYALFLIQTVNQLLTIYATPVMMVIPLIHQLTNA